jgi:hypothetical protein
MLRATCYGSARAVRPAAERAPRARRIAANIAKLPEMLHDQPLTRARGAHYDQTLALYDPAQHRPLATRFGQDIRMATLSYRSLALWMLGYPKAALADAHHALSDAREIGHAATLMYALIHSSTFHTFCGNYPAATEQSVEAVALAGEKGAVVWKAAGTWTQGYLFTLTGRASDAVQTITSGLAAWRSTGATGWLPLSLSYLTRAYAEFGKFDDAWRCIRVSVVRDFETGGGLI